ncbi:MAG: right-handed parallel beta-helix repeat-containing protein, partial [Clostridia bacterium]|nr:right-handed parallel beta-helix repeat-containing protein [Clostridia bacterium]
MGIRIINTQKTAVTAKDLTEGLAQIKELAKTATAESPLEVSLILDADRYHLSAPIELSAEKEPALANVRLTIKGKDGMTPKLSGAWYFYHDKFEAVKGKPYYKYQLEKGADKKYPQFREMMVDRRRIEMAKSDFYLYPFSALHRDEADEATFQRGLFAPLDMAKALAKDKTKSKELQILLEWEHRIFRITGVDLETVRTCDGKEYALLELDEEYRTFVKEGRFSLLDLKGRRFFVTNSLAFLKEDTFVYDYKRGTAYYYPGKQMDIVHHTQEYCLLEQLLVLEGLEGLTLENLAFVGTTSKHVCENGYTAGQANAVRTAGKNGVFFRHLPVGAVCTRNMRSFTVKNCTFTDIGGNAILMQDKSTGVFIEHCRFERIGMSAAVIGNAANQISAWENPDNRNIAIHFNHNYIRHVAHDYPAACAFYTALVDGIEFTHNTVIDVGYSCFSAGWNWVQVPYAYGE